MNKIKVGTLGLVNLDYPTSGFDSFISYIIKAMKSTYDVEFIGLRPFLDEKKVDILLIPCLTVFYYSRKDFPMDDLMSYIKEVSRIQWYACWYGSPLVCFPTNFRPIKAKRALCSFPEVGKETELAGLAENITMWTPPVKPLMLEKEPYILNKAFETPHKLNLALLALAPTLYENFGISINAYSFDWYLDRSPHLKTEIDFVDAHLHEGLKLFRGGINFYEFQKLLAKARILCSLRGGWELQSLEAWVHGTPVITRDHAGFLAPDYGISSRCEEEADITGISECIKGILEGAYNSQIERTIAHVRDISNHEIQIKIIKTCLDEDLG